MATKLKSLLAEKTLWRLLLKTALVAAVLFAVRPTGQGGPTGLLGFIILTFVFVALYFRETGERRSLRFSYFLLALLSLVALRLIGSLGPLGSIGLIVLIAFLFFVLLGLMEFFFKNRLAVYSVFSTGLLLAFFLVTFFLANPQNFWSFAVFIFIIVVLIFMEVFKFFGVAAGKKAFILSSVPALLGAELAWVAELLPFGFINSAAFLTLFLLLTRDAVIAGLKGELSFSLLMRELLFFAVFTIIIFAASKWTI